MARFMRWAGERRGVPFTGYDELWRWSVAELEQFWAALWEFTGVRASRPYARVLSSHEMPGARWFEGAGSTTPRTCSPDATRGGQPSCTSRRLRDLEELSWGELRAPGRGRRRRPSRPRRGPRRPRRRVHAEHPRDAASRSSPRPPSARSGRAPPPSSGRAASSTGSPRSHPRCSSRWTATATAARTSTAAPSSTGSSASCPPSSTW